MIEFMTNKWGHPWHGLWRAGTGKITTPAGGDIDLPGDAPATGSAFPPGDCYLVQVPGRPPVETTPEEAAAGQTWLSYGLMCGPGHVLYGRCIGASNWIYIDPAGRPWLAALVWSPSATSGTVALTSFGVVSGQEDPAQTLDFSIPAGQVAGARVMIDDITSDGGKVAVTTFDSVSDTAGIRDVRGGVQLALAGTPPAATCVATVVVTDEVAGGSTDSAVTLTRSAWWWQGFEPDYELQYIGRTDSTSGSPPPPPGWSSGHGASLSGNTSMIGTYGLSNQVFGLCYDDSGTLHSVTCSIVSSVAASCDVTPDPDQVSYSFVGAGNTSTQLVLRIGEQELSVSANHEYSINGSSSGGSVMSEVSTFDDLSQAHHDGAIANVATVMSYPVVLGTNLWEPAVGLGTYGLLACRRLANRVYGLQEARKDYSTGLTTLVRHIGLVTPHQIDATVTSGPAPLARYATRHPVTGDLIQAPTPVCFV